MMNNYPQKVNVAQIVPPQKDYERLNRYLLGLLHLDSAINNLLSMMIEEFKTQGVYRMSIKNKCKEIRRMLRTNPKNDWNTISDDAIDDFCEDADRFEDMIFKFLGLEKGINLLIRPLYSRGQIVWILENKEPRQALVLEVNIIFHHTDKGVQDDSYYLVQPLSNTTGKPLEREPIRADEKDIYKTKKSAYENK